LPLAYATPVASPVASPFCLCGVLILNKTRIKTIANYCPQRNSNLCFCLCPIGNSPEGLLQEKAKGEAKGEAKGARQTNNKTT
jgi:hypothetical protein